MNDYSIVLVEIIIILSSSSCVGTIPALALVEITFQVLQSHVGRGVPAPARKVEGFDLRATLSPPCRTEPQMNPNYRSSIESLKSRTRTKDLEDEYIKGLQE